MLSLWLFTRRPGAHVPVGLSRGAVLCDGRRRATIASSPISTRDDFEILDNGRPQEITIFDNEVRPFSVVVMLDTSISMTDRLKDLYAGAEQFLLRLLPHDKADRRRVQRQGRVRRPVSPATVTASSAR